MSAGVANSGRHQEHLLSECERRDHTQLWHAVWQHFFWKQRDHICALVGDCLVDHLLHINIVHRVDVPDRDVTFPVSRATHYFPVWLLHDCGTRLFNWLESDGLQLDCVQADEEWTDAAQRISCAGCWADLMHFIVHDDLLFQHVFIDLVGGARIDMVPGCWFKVGPRSHWEHIFIFSFGCMGNPWR